MRYLVGFVLALALASAPLTANAEAAEKAVQEPPPWLRLELDTAGLRMTSSMPVAPEPQPKPLSRGAIAAIAVILSVVVIGGAVGGGLRAGNLFEDP